LSLKFDAFYRICLNIFFAPIFSSRAVGASILDSKEAHSISAKGMTLVELMITVAIVGTLAALANIQYKQFYFRAKNVEAMQNVNLAFAMVNSWIVENSEIDSSACPNTFTLSSGEIACRMSSNSNWDNPFGYQLPDPTKSRFSISYVSSPGSWTVLASSEAGYMGCPGSGQQIYVKGHCGRLCLRTQMNFEDCTVQHMPGCSLFPCP